MTINHERNLPPDSEEMNTTRAVWGLAALNEFQVVTGTEDGDAVSDLLADVMHLCDRYPRFEAFEDALARAQENYTQETTPDGRRRTRRAERRRR